MTTVLVVDDTATARDVLSRMLERVCDRVLVAADGETALERMRGERVDVVVADVLMPGMDGYELVRRMRRDVALANVPVIFCTSFYLDEEAKALARAVGVAHVLAKPIDKGTLLRAVEEALGGDEPATAPLGLATETADFDHEHARLVTTKLAEKVAQLEELQGRLVARARRSEHLVGTLAAVGAAATLREGLEALLRGAMALIGGQRAVARVFDPETGAYLLHLRLDADGRISEQVRPPPPEPGSHGARLGKGGAAELIRDYGALSEEERTQRARWVMAGTASGVHVPIDAAGRRIGAMHLNHTVPNAFGTEELALAEALAMQAGSAIDRARLTSAGAASERALLESEARYRTLAESAPVGIFQTIPSGEAVYVNRQWETITGQPGPESLGHGWTNAMHPEDRDATMRKWHASMRKGVGHTDEFRILRPDGTIRTVLANAAPTRRDGGELSGYVGTLSDVTSQREAARHLARVNERLRLLLDIADPLASTLEPEAILTSLLARLVRTLPGADLGAVFLHNVSTNQLVPHATVGWDQESHTKTRLRPGESASGTVFETGRPLWVGDGDDVGMAHTSPTAVTGQVGDAASDPTRPRSSLTAPLKTSEGTILGTVSVGSTTAVLEETDLPLVEGMGSQLAMALQKGRLYAEARASEGMLRTLNSKLEQQARELEGAVADAKSAQDMVVQQERMRAVGEMASGIAHDLNNALAPVVGFSELLLVAPGALEDIPRARQYLTMIHKGADDAAKVVARLREFYRQRGEDEVFAAVDLPTVVREVVSLTQPKWKDQAQADGRTVEMVMELGDVPPVAGHESELRELLTNLIFNAVDAMPHGGTIRLTVRHDAATETVLTEVADGGMGMTEEVRRRCLEPFFSTKGERGTGLGLSMVHGTVQRHQGTMEISSSMGVGTTFRISLPVGSEAPDRVQEDRGGSVRPLRVLVVDDEPAVRAVTVAYLEADGHTVEQAENGREAMALLRSGALDLLITDRAMPGMSGDQLAMAAMHAFPDLPVILLTGFGGLMEAAGESPPGVDLVIGKPVTRTLLRRALEQTRVS